jgi:hypothetical protein
MDLSCVVINKPPPAAAAGSAGDRDLPQGKYEATPNTLYIGGLPIEWTNEQVCADLCAPGAVCRSESQMQLWPTADCQLAR